MATQHFQLIKVFAPGKPPVDYQGARDTLALAAPSSSRSSPSFNHYVGAEQWASGVCKSPKNRCISTLPKIFMVHGLRPSNMGRTQPSINILKPMLTTPQPSILFFVSSD
ncbi:ribonuclease T2 family protein [Medicago truncatula]|uniref:Ribonuclease T2 family protein n=1 Tax=Medicago truncatula TaxID=3880 RepID=A0A072VF14_MEDTR|nr:ribonuclease T2 family protein [Medicago truncatula]